MGNNIANALFASKVKCLGLLLIKSVLHINNVIHMKWQPTATNDRLRCYVFSKNIVRYLDQAKKTRNKEHIKFAQIWFNFKQIHGFCLFYSFFCVFETTK